MATIVVPTTGAPDPAPGADALVGVDGNVFSVLGTTKRLLRRAGASDEYVAAYLAEATAGDYDHAIQASMAYLDGSPAEASDGPA